MAPVAPPLATPVPTDSGVARLSAARGRHKSASLFTYKICLQEF